MIILFRSIFIGEKDIESNQNSKMNLNYFCYRLRRPKLIYKESQKTGELEDELENFTRHFRKN